MATMLPGCARVAAEAVVTYGSACNRSLRLRGCFAARSSHFAQDDTGRSTIPGMERRSVVEYLEDFLRRGRECAYLQHRGYRTVRWTYRQVAETAFRFARELEERGIGKGERVLLWGPNSAEWVAAFFRLRPAWRDRSAYR